MGIVGLTYERWDGGLELPVRSDRVLGEEFRKEVLDGSGDPLLILDDVAGTVLDLVDEEMIPLLLDVVVEELRITITLQIPL